MFSYEVTYCLMLILGCVDDDVTINPHQESLPGRTRSCRCSPCQARGSEILESAPDVASLFNVSAIAFPSDAPLDRESVLCNIVTYTSTACSAWLSSGAFPAHSNRSPRRVAL